MKLNLDIRPSILNGWHACGLGLMFSASAIALELRTDGYHVYPTDRIQDAIELAGKNPTNKLVRVHPGEYRPSAMRQALVWFNRAHDGVQVKATGPVTLTAANPALASKSRASFPAMVNHVVYFGDGVSSNTLLEGFRITGANRFVTDKFTTQIEPDETIPKNSFFLTDGGAIKIFGRSYPTIRNIEFLENDASPCAGAVSVQHQGFNTNWVVFENCIFRNNRAQVTGSALDLLHGSAARVINCLFVGNISNTGEDIVSKRSGETPFTNSGVLTIFDDSRAIVERCTFTANRNGVDDLGGQSVYRDCIFYRNILPGGETERYESDLAKGGAVTNCYFGGRIIDPRNDVAARANSFACPDPRFDPNFAPRNEVFKGAGYRPAPTKP